MENVLLHENKIASLPAQNDVHRTPLLCQLSASSTGDNPWSGYTHIPKNVIGGELKSKQREVWKGFPSLCELFISQHVIKFIDRLSTPNLVHLTLELLVTNSWINQDRSPFLYLCNIELSVGEVRSGLETHLQFLQHVAADFRMLSVIVTDAHGNVSPPTITAVQYMLRRTNVYSITLTIPSDSQSPLYLLIRFEGPQGSLETTIYCADHARFQNVLFGSGGVAPSLSRRIDSVRELRIAGCSFDDDQGLDHQGGHAEPRLHIHRLRGTSRSSQPTPLLPPFQHLERIMVLGSELGLGGVARARRDCGVPLTTVIIRQGPK